MKENDSLIMHLTHELCQNRSKIFDDVVNPFEISSLVTQPMTQQSSKII